MHVFKDRVVTLEYTITDEQGNSIDTSDNGEPLSFIQGRETIFPALEAAIEGRAMGDQLVVHLAPADAFGEINETLIRQVPRSKIKVTGDIKVGMHLRPHQIELDTPLVVSAFDENTVTLDANHPLAGKVLDVALVITEVREAIVEELQSGQIQGMAEIYSRDKGDSVLVDFKM